MDLSETWPDLIPETGSLEDFVAAIGEAKGRPIRVIEVKNMTASAYVAGTDAGYLLAVRATKNARHRTHAICHELGHIVHGHDMEGREMVKEYGSSGCESMLTGVGKSRILGIKARRGDFLDPVEKEAEATAHAMMRALEVARQDFVTARMI